MRVLLHTYFPLLVERHVGGAQVAVDQLVRGLLEAGVEIVAATPPPPARGHALLDHPLLRHASTLQAVEDEHAKPPALHHDRRALAELVPLADVVITVDAHLPVPAPCPVVLMVNNFSYGPECRSVFGLNWDALVAPSSFLLDCIDWYFGDAAWVGKPRPRHAVPLAVPVPPSTDPGTRAATRRDLGVAADALCLAFPHRADPHKGFDVALAAVAELRHRGRPAILLVPEADDRELYPDQRRHTRERTRAAAALGSGAVAFHPWVERPRLGAHLAAADWTLCPTHLDESFGLVVAESVAAGTPVVATPAGAIPELLPPGHGVILVEFDDASAIADAVANGPDGAALARGRNAIVERFAPDAVIARWLEILRTTTAATGVHSPLATPPANRVPPWRRTVPSGRTWDLLDRAYVA